MIIAAAYIERQLKIKTKVKLVRTFIMNFEIAMREAYVSVLVFRVPGTRQRCLLLVYFGVEPQKTVRLDACGIHEIYIR